MSALPAHHRIEAPRPAAGESKIQKCKTKADGEVAFTDSRKEAARKMLDEIGRGHFAGQDKSHRPREQADGEQEAADQLEQPTDPSQRIALEVFEHRDDRQADKLAHAILKQGQAVE